MDQETLWNEVRSLPPNARQQVVDFIAFLQARYNVQSQSDVAKRGALEDEPFIGMWADRSDMSDSAAWVRSLRADEWQRGHE